MSSLSGFINQKIIIKTANDVDDGAGGTVPEEIVYWETNASVKKLSAGKRLESNQESLKPVWRFEIRYRDDKNLQHNMSIMWRGVRYAIVNIDEIDYVYKRFISFTATASEVAPL